MQSSTFQIKVKTLEVLNILRANREGHAIEVQEAIEGFRTKAATELRKRAKQIAEGKSTSTRFSLPYPVSYLEEYDRAIRMCEMHTDEILILDEGRFREWIKNEWSWRRAYIGSNALYSASLTSALPPGEYMP